MMEESDIFESAGQLKKQAADLLRHCHAPYSNLCVTSFVLAQSKTDASDRRVFNGVNVECVSYSLCMCAERVAICKAVCLGYTGILKVATICASDDSCQADSNIVVGSLRGCWPCGACRQVIAEFSNDSQCEIITIDKNGQLIGKDIGELLPNRFKLTGHA